MLPRIARIARSTARRGGARAGKSAGGVLSVTTRAVPGSEYPQAAKRFGATVARVSDQATSRPLTPRVPDQAQHGQNWSLATGTPDRGPGRPVCRRHRALVAPRAVVPDARAAAPLRQKRRRGANG